MRRCLLAGLGFLAIAALASAAHAQRFELDYTGRLVKFTVPIDGGYTIVAFGAQGGSNFNFPNFMGVVRVSAGDRGAGTVYRGGSPIQFREEPQ